MVNTLWLKFTLLSDATFGRGDGVAGLVDEEVQHDEHGLPFLNGRTLKGLLAAECAEILFALERIQPNQMARWTRAAQGLFGNHGSRADDIARLRVGDAQLPDDLRTAIAEDFRRDKNLTRAEVLESLTTIRKQTAMDPKTGAPLENTLRASRVILRQTPFWARLDFATPATDDELALLAACVRAFRRAGTARTRGRGRLHADLFVPNQPNAVTEQYLEQFEKAVAQ